MQEREYYKKCATNFFNNAQSMGGIVGHHNLNPVKLLLARGNGNPEYIWCINPTDDTKTIYIASELLPGRYYCHLTNQVVEWPRNWVITFGEVEYLFDEIIVNPAT